MNRIISVIGAVVISASLGLTAVAQTAQENPDPGDVLQQLLDQIKSSNDAGIATKAEVELELEDAVISVQQAGSYFDTIINELKERAELGNPEGQFVQNIEALEAEMRTVAAEALANGDTEYAPQFEQEANEYQAAATLARQYYDGLGFRIDNINALRTKVVYEIKLRRSKQAREIVQRGLDMLAETDSQLADAEEKLRLIFGEPDPGGSQ